MVPNPRAPALVAYRVAVAAALGSSFSLVDASLEFLGAAVGGIAVGQGTLLRFYVAHVIFFPLVTALFLVVHFWRIRKDGGISGPV